MKKLIAITLIVTLLFNLGGYLLAYSYLKQRSDRYFDLQAAKALYCKAELVEIKIPVEMPDIINWPRYEAIKGRIQFGNSTYNYVKMRMTQHAMYLLCVPNYESGHLNNVNVINAKNIADIPVPKKSHAPDIKLQALQKYESIKPASSFAPPVKFVEIKLAAPVQFYDGIFIDIPEQPPKANC